MQSVRKKERKKSPRRVGLLLLCVSLLALAAGLYLWAEQPAQIATETHESPKKLLIERGEDQVARVASTLRLGESWAMVLRDGALVMEDDPSFPVDPLRSDYILQAAAVIEVPAVLAEDASHYDGSEDEFGLTEPRAVVDILYADGAQLTLRIGDRIAYEDVSWLYMTVDGDPALYAIDKGTADVLTADRSLLRDILQPTLHADRFDRITLETESGVVEWALEGAIDSGDASERWSLTQPLTYPADATALSSLRDHVASLRLGAYVAPATAENLTLYGFDAPRLTLTVHQAAGVMGTTNASGEYETTQWPESTFTLAVGGARSQDVDYVCWEGDIYLTSHYALTSLLNPEWQKTLTRFPVLTALGNLRRLTIERPGEVTEEYVVARTEQVAENNELVTDLQGHTVYDYACTRNGAPVSYSAFESAYGRLVVTMVSGVLPEVWAQQEEPHTVYTFEDINGAVHTVALADFDALHDAVIVDGHAMFYLIKDGFRLEME